MSQSIADQQYRPRTTERSTETTGETLEIEHVPLDEVSFEYVDPTMSEMRAMVGELSINSARSALANADRWIAKDQRDDARYEEVRTEMENLPASVRWTMYGHPRDMIRGLGLVVEAIKLEWVDFLDSDNLAEAKEERNQKLDALFDQLRVISPSIDFQFDVYEQLEQIRKIVVRVDSDTRHGQKYIGEDDSLEGIRKASMWGGNLYAAAAITGFQALELYDAQRVEKDIRGRFEAIDTMLASVITLEEHMSAANLPQSEPLSAVIAQGVLDEIRERVASLDSVFSKSNLEALNTSVHTLREAIDESQRQGLASLDRFARNFLMNGAA